MNRTTIALLAALEAIIVVAIGVGIALVPLTILWAAQYHLAVDWLLFWRASGDIWLLGHGVNLTIALDPVTAATVGLPGAATPFQLTIAALGIALFTLVMGVRIGLRASETPYRSTGAVSAVVVFAALSALITLTSKSAPVTPSLWQGIVLPPFVFALGIVIGAAVGGVRRARVAPETVTVTGTMPLSTVRSTPVTDLRAFIARLPPALRAGSAAAVRAGTAAAAIVLGVSAVILAVLILTDFGTVIGLYEQLQTGALGGAALTIAQLVFVPNFVIWVASWMTGAGFAIGTGSSVGPIGTQLGPIPTVPLFGTLPAGHLAFGFLGLLVPLLAGFLAAALMRSRLAADGNRHGPGWMFLTALGIGVVAGIELGLLAWWSSGALGPGRLHDVGPNPWLVGSLAAAEIAIGSIIGMTAGGLRRR